MEKKEHAHAKKIMNKNDLRVNVKVMTKEMHISYRQNKYHITWYKLELVKDDEQNQKFLWKIIINLFGLRFWNSCIDSFRLTIFYIMMYHDMLWLISNCQEFNMSHSKKNHHFHSIVAEQTQCRCRMYHLGKTKA